MFYFVAGSRSNKSILSAKGSDGTEEEISDYDMESGLTLNASV